MAMRSAHLVDHWSHRPAERLDELAARRATGAVELAEAAEPRQALCYAEATRRLINGLLSLRGCYGRQGELSMNTEFCFNIRNADRSVGASLELTLELSSGNAGTAGKLGVRLRAAWVPD